LDSLKYKCSEKALSALLLEGKSSCAWVCRNHF